jgi:DNA repair photolyase
MDELPHKPARGRGALSNPDNRFAEHRREGVADGWYQEEPEPLRTTVEVDASRSLISYNRSPDIPFDRSINPYRGCEHGCIYCYARPTHAWLGLSPGLDFESRLFYKADAARLLRQELARPGYVPDTLVIGANTDPYQPLEKRLRVTRQVLEVLAACRHPVAITTKSALVLRDRDLLVAMAEHRLVAVNLTITTLDPALARRLEPRAAAPQRRLEVVQALAVTGVPVGVLVSPMIPALNDHELERILEASAAAGATRAGMLLLRLPLEIKDMFQEWLAEHYRDRAQRVLGLIRQCREGKLNDARFGTRMSGTGPYAALLHKRFELATKRLGLNRNDAAWELDASRFTPPSRPGQQLSLFD